MSIQLVPGQHIHIVGIGGFGMSAIARVLLETGYVVSGSDQQSGALTTALAADGATVHIGHAAQNVGNVNLVMASSAIPDNNPELQAARARNIPVLRRRDAIGVLTANYRTIAVAGTHGKTTTTALLGHVLIEAGLDPTIIVGGIVRGLGTNARVGQSNLFVIEADEYGKMFLGLSPEIAIITNIEHDHPDHFPTLDSLTETFREFVRRIQPIDGLLVAGFDSPEATRLAEDHRKAQNAVVSYGLANADWQAVDIQAMPGGMTHFAVQKNNMVVGTATLNMRGNFNVQNALAVIAVAYHLEVSFDQITSALATFPGTGRRAEIIGEVNGVTIISDYAHHPTAIRATLEAWSDHCLWAVWQPHTYNRLRALPSEFANAFSHADHVLVTDVYSVREAVVPGLSSPELVEMIKATGHEDVRYSGGSTETAALLAREVVAGDYVIILSAGDAPQIGQLLIEGRAKG